MDNNEVNPTRCTLPQICAALADTDAWNIVKDNTITLYSSKYNVYYDCVGMFLYTKVPTYNNGTLIDTIQFVQHTRNNTVSSSMQYVYIDPMSPLGFIAKNLYVSVLFRNDIIEI